MLWATPEISFFRFSEIPVTKTWLLYSTLAVALRDIALAIPKKIRASPENWKIMPKAWIISLLGRMFENKLITSGWLTSINIPMVDRTVPIAKQAGAEKFLLRIKMVS
jgi:hypothetical protein